MATLPPMEPAGLAPNVHFFVCVNRRPPLASGEPSPLGPGCGEAGDGVYLALKNEVARRGDVRNVWVTRSLCLGVCPRRGCTLATWRGGASGSAKGALVKEVFPEDVPAIYEGKAP